MSHEATQPHAVDHASGSHQDHDHHEHGTRTYWLVFVALMVLLLATVGVAYFNMGALNVPVAYAIATLKAVLILWFFMHLNESTRLTQVFAFASFAWLLIFMIMTASDYLSRHILKRADEMTIIRRVDSHEQQSGYQSNLLPGQPSYRQRQAAAATRAATQPAATQPAGTPSTTQPAR